MARLTDLFEGYKILPSIDRDKYTPLDGLEGPFRLRNGMVVYYDPKEGAYYDRDRDMYLSYDEYRDADRDTDMVKESEDIYIEVAVSSARRALELLDDMFRGQYDHNGSNHYVFDSEDVAEDVLQTFEDSGIEVVDHSVGYDIDESADDSGASVQADYTDPNGRFVVIYDIGSNRFFTMGIGQYGEKLPIERAGYKDMEAAIEYAEEMLDESLQEVEIEEEKLPRDEYIAKKKEIENRIRELVTGDPSKDYYWDDWQKAIKDPAKAEELKSLRKQIQSLEVIREPRKMPKDKFALDAPTLPGGRSPSH